MSLSQKLSQKEKDAALSEVAALFKDKTVQISTDLKYAKSRKSPRKDSKTMLRSLLHRTDAGNGVPCGRSFMSKGETCHVGKAGGISKSVSEKMTTADAIAHLKSKVLTPEDKGDMLEMASELNASDFKERLKGVLGDIKAAKTGVIPDSWGWGDDEIETFKKDPWGSSEYFEDEKSAKVAEEMSMKASHPGFRKYAKSLYKASDEVWESELNKIGKATGGIKVGKTLYS
jgi:hypothetical protein